jgi:tetratricopeptide (TPR) repeat protein
MSSTLLLAVAYAAPSTGDAVASQSDAAAPDLDARSDLSPSGQPVATVLDHRVVVTIDGVKRLTESVTWTVRIDDPQRCSAGVLAPPGLDGASDGGAQVLEDLLVVPEGTAAGTTFTLKGTRPGPSGAHSGLFYTAPELPTQHAMLTVSAPSWVPLTLWADPAAVPTYDPRSTRTVSMEWTDLPGGSLGQAVWGTWADWLEPSERLVELVNSKLADKVSLGQELAEDSLGTGLVGITERVLDKIELSPGAPGTWEGARSAAEVASSRSGTAAERGLVLVTMLRLAGLDALPAYYRSAHVPGPFPTTVPAPALLPRPLVVVRRPEGHVYIDPAAERTAIPDRPASLLGATVWVPGELPVRLPDEGVVDGQVTITTHLALDTGGGATWTANLVASGAAQEYLRELLSPLDEAGRAQAMEKLVKQGRPSSSRVTAQITGVESPTRKLTIVINGHDEGALEASSMGWRGTVAPTLAPALGAWLPPRLAIEEIVAITPPSNLAVLGTTLERGAYRSEALVGRSARREGQRVVLVTSVERPYRSTTPSKDAAAAELLAAEASKGVEILLFGGKIRPTVRAIRTSEAWPPLDRAVLEPLMWYGVNNEPKALTAYAKALEAFGTEAVVGVLARFADASDLRPWLGLYRSPDFDDRGRVAVALQLARLGARKEAQELASELQDSNDAWVRMQALMLAERLMPPAPRFDPVAGEKHRELLGKAEKAAESLGTESVAEIRLRRAELALAEGDLPSAARALDGLPETPIVRIMRASTEGTVEEVRAATRAALGEHPEDIAVVAAAARALERVGEHEQALQLVLQAARIAHDDPDLWEQVVAPALGAGDLPTAAHAARRASDLDPEHQERAATWARLATLMLARDEVDTARLRAGLEPVTGWPPSVDERMSLDEAAWLAVLEHAEEAVASDPRLLAIRAQLRIAGNTLDEAARDGLVLATRHATPEGYALAFAATVGRQYSTSLLRALDDAARTEPTATTTRMEYRLIAGTGDPLVDAWRLREDPRAQTVLKWAQKPALSVAGLEGWPAKIPAPPSQAPKGYHPNRTLSVLPGVRGWSNPESATAIVRIGARIPEGLLPPPFGLLYEANPQVVESTEAGTRVLRLEGGVMPLYAAISPADTGEVWGFGFTAEAARRALTAGMP